MGFRVRTALPLSFLIILTVVLAAGELAVFKLWLFAVSPSGNEGTVRLVDVPERTGALEIARLLRKQGVIRDSRAFYLLCRLKKASQRLQAGEYGFSGASTPLQIMNQMVAGKVFLHRITLQEGLTLRDVASLLAERGLVSKNEFLRKASDEHLARSMGIPGFSFEGYLFPETYAFSRKEKDIGVIKAMVKQFWNRLPQDWEKRVSELGMSLHEVVIMASIVEKEAAVDAERPLIAAVLFNRLKKKMFLQSDPTAVYDLEDFSGPVLPEHLKRASPYNTYRNPGLPVGPICCPGKRSIAAVLNPEPVNYLFFVSNNDGTHTFSETYEEHEQAVSRYRQMRQQKDPRASREKKH